MRNRINTFFIGGLLEHAEPFDVARIKLIYNFNLLYALTSIGLGTVLFKSSLAYGLIALTVIFIFCGMVLYALHRQKLQQAIYTYIALHLLLGPTIMLFKRGEFSMMDFGMGFVLVIFGWLTLDKIKATIWAVFEMSLAGMALFMTETLKRTIDINGPVPYMKSDEPPAAIYFPMIMVVYMLYVYMNSKTKAETLIQQQKDALRIKNHEIGESLRYASGIQQTLLPSEKVFTDHFPSHFIFYKAKEEVSGDFYFFGKNGNDIFVAVADCTGHGVPGAFMSLVCSKELSLACTQSNDVSEILNRINRQVKEALKQNQFETYRDGMDITLIRVSGKNISYAGANRPLWLIRNGQNQIIDFKPTKSAIAGFTPDDKVFEAHHFSVEPGDMIYMFTDGYADQFGGPSQKKMTTKRFREKILSVHHHPAGEQKKLLENFFHEWKGNVEQIDDVLVAGIRF